MSEPLRFARLDYADAADAAILVALLDAYARDPMGGGRPLGDGARARLAPLLARTPQAFSIVGRRGAEAVALANCFEGVSTFAARPLVNVHDLVVVAAERGRGTGGALLAAVEREARRRGCCKLTLEVLEGNAPARALYAKVGFRSYALDAATGTAVFLEKPLGGEANVRPTPST